MRIDIANTVVHDHAELREIIRAGFADVEHTDIEAHVRSRPPRIEWFVPCLDETHTYNTAPWHKLGQGHLGSSRRHVLRQGHTRDEAKRIETPRYWYSGRAYNGIPNVSHVRRGMRYLVTMVIPPDVTVVPAGTYPRGVSYGDHGRLKNAPSIVVACWREELFYLAAHESCHVRQFKQKMPCSEVDADRWALARLNEYRKASL